MSRVSRLATEEVFKRVEDGLKDLGKFNKIAIKLKAILACKANSLTKVAKVFNINRGALSEWIKSVKTKGIDELFVKSGRGKKLIVSKEYYPIIKEWLQDNPNLTINNVKQMILERLHIKIGRTATYHLIQKLNLSYITPRPKHYKSNQEEQNVFKKNSKNCN